MLGATGLLNWSPDGLSVDLPWDGWLVLLAWATWLVGVIVHQWDTPRQHTRSLLSGPTSLYVWYIPCEKEGGCMTDTSIARLFRNGRSQAVRLPRAFRFAGDRVRIRRFGRGVLLEPLLVEADDWFREMDRSGADSLLPEGRAQPPAPIRDIDLS